MAETTHLLLLLLLLLLQIFWVFAFLSNPVLSQFDEFIFDRFDGEDTTNISLNGNFSNHVFAVEFDTVQDYEFQDINDNHVGIDINTMASNKSVAAAYFLDNSTTKKDFDLKSGQTIQAWVNYDSKRHEVSVWLSPSSEKPKSQILSFHVDLSPILKDYMYVGFSASTGLVASSHYVFGWSFTMNGEAKSLSLSSLPTLSKPKKIRTTLIVHISIPAVALLVSAIGTTLYLVRKFKNMEVV